MHGKLRTAFHLVLIAGLAWAIYLPALDASFHLDDSPSIRDNPVIRELDPGRIAGFWPTRTVTYFSLALNFRAGGLNPRIYHAVNLAIHVLNSFLVYALLRLLLAGQPGTAARRSWAAAGGALVFALHPLQTQAVTYVVQRATSLGTFLVLLTLVLYCRGRRGKPGSLGRLLAFQGALLAEVLALLTKEFTVITPFLLLAIEAVHAKNLRKLPGKRLAPFLAAVLLIPVLILLHSDNPYYNDSGQLDWLSRSGMNLNTTPGKGISPATYLATQERVFLTYLRLLFVPLNQQLEYDCPWQTSCLAFPAILGAAAAGAALLLAIRLRRTTPIGALGLFWFLCALIPESSLIPISDPAVEHRLYLPLVGAALALAAWIASWPGGKTRKIIFGLILLQFGYLAYQRNQVWLNPITLWEDNVAKAGGKARVHGNLGKAYLDAGRYGRAAEEFERMLELDPTYTGAYNNLAVIYIDHQRDDAKARHYILKALELFPEYPSGYLNLGVIEMNNLRWLPAIRYFEKTLALDPDNQTAHYNIAASYFNLSSRLRREGEQLAEGGNASAARDKIGEAAQALERAFEYARRGGELWPADPRFPHLLGLICKAQGREKEAKDHFGEARLLKTRLGGN